MYVILCSNAKLLRDPSLIFQNMNIIASPCCYPVAYVNHIYVSFKCYISNSLNFSLSLIAPHFTIFQLCADLFHPFIDFLPSFWAIIFESHICFVVSVILICGRPPLTREKKKLIISDKFFFFITFVKRYQSFKKYNCN
jgi:hypothetical protein